MFEERREKNPCALCAKMRRGALASACMELGLNKLALGHHRDDALETLLMSVLYEGQMCIRDSSRGGRRRGEFAAAPGIGAAGTDVYKRQSPVPYPRRSDPSAARAEFSA